MKVYFKTQFSLELLLSTLINFQLFLVRGSLYALPNANDHISLMLVRWLLFRMMFASGIVKLTSGCPTWWGLTALPLHYESQCIPTPLAWYAHRWMPDVMHQVKLLFQQLNYV